MAQTFLSLVGIGAVATFVCSVLTSLRVIRERLNRIQNVLGEIANSTTTLHSPFPQPSIEEAMDADGNSAAPGA